MEEPSGAPPGRAALWWRSGAGGSSADRRPEMGGGRWPGGSLGGGGRGVWGRAGVGVAPLTELPPAFPAGPAAVVLPRCLPPPPPPPGGCLPPSRLPRCPAQRRAPPAAALPPVLFGWGSLMAAGRRQCRGPTAGGQTRGRGQIGGAVRGEGEEGRASAAPRRGFGARRGELVRNVPSPPRCLGPSGAAWPCCGPGGSAVGLFISPEGPCLAVGGRWATRAVPARRGEGKPCPGRCPVPRDNPVSFPQAPARFGAALAESGKERELHCECYFYTYFCPRQTCSLFSRGRGKRRGLGAGWGHSWARQLLPRGGRGAAPPRGGSCCRRSCGAAPEADGLLRPARREGGHLAGALWRREAGTELHGQAPSAIFVCFLWFFFFSLPFSSILYPSCLEAGGR